MIYMLIYIEIKLNLLHTRDSVSTILYWFYMAIMRVMARMQELAT